MNVEGSLELDVQHFGRTPEFYMDVPDWYWRHEGHTTVKAPGATTISYNKAAKSRRPLEGEWLLRHYINKRGEWEKHPRLSPDLVALKAFGEPRRYYRVVVTDGLAEFCGMEAGEINHRQVTA